MFQTYFPPSTTVVYPTESHLSERLPVETRLLWGSPLSGVRVDGWTICSTGLEQLRSDLLSFQPNLCVLLGGTALAAAKGIVPNVYLSDRDKSPDGSITLWRGSLFTAATDSPCPDAKCISTFHPASSLRVYEQTPLILFDLKRARRQGEGRELRLPNRNIKVLRSSEEVSYELGRMRSNKKKIATDIEGYVNNLTCISFADDPLMGYVIPFV